MPSYRYLRDIKPEDLQNPEDTPKQYTRRERAANWLRYHWYWLVGGAVLLALATGFIVERVTKVTPDVQVAILTQDGLPDAVVSGLEAALGEYVADTNGDGKQVVSVDVYQIKPGEGEAASATASGTASEAAGEAAGATAPEDPYQQMAGVTKLVAAGQIGEPALFLIQPDMLEAMREQYGIPATLVGEDAPAGQPAADDTVALETLVLWQGLELPLETLDGEVLDGRQLLEGYRFGMMPRHADSEKKDEIWQTARAFLEDMA